MTSLNCALAEALAGVPAVVLPLAFLIVSHSLSGSMENMVEPIGRTGCIVPA